ncbi:ribosomal protein S18-alanine N-acetyltransferase [Psychrobacter sp. GP33]|uniref:ribosomal protein S18-alanine N-acetyltransferase n=1 Tax=Psychrobacter sp. GP33 TaxID=2758709 RepID=UPI0015FAC436|nr:ribosomal protein S18-alanine N-acetyltransferase [Psychrobacter sp. GP33]
MLSVKHLSNDVAERQQDIQSVADIEAIIHQQDIWTYESLTGLLTQDSVKLLVAIHKTSENPGAVVGYCLYQVVFEQAEILRIGTHPNYQRQGIASQLFATLNNELQADKIESLLLEVRADNAPAIALYQQQGFDEIHRRKDYYQHSHKPAMDALIMQLSYV